MGNPLQHDFLRSASAAARAGGKIALDFYDKDKDISYKNEERTSIVTEADIAAEEKIVAMLKAEYPGHGFLTEEKLSANENAEYVWVVDPIDGTANYAHHVPLFMTAIGLKRRGELILAVAYDPVHDELFSAEKGKGAFLNGKPIHVSDRSRGRAYIMFIWSRRFGTTSFLDRLFTCGMKVSDLRSGIVTFCYIAAGRIDGTIGRGLAPWDLTAALIISEAGGRVTSLSGGEFRLEGDEILASNGVIHDELLRIVNQSQG